MAVSELGDYTTRSSAGTIQYTGLTSETRWADLVDELITLEQFQIKRMNTWKQEWQEKITAIKGLDSRLLQLKAKAGDINTAMEFQALSSSSNDENVLLVTNAALAAKGAHLVTVGTDIPHIIASQGISSKTDAIGVIADTNYNQDFIISAGSSTITIDFVASAPSGGYTAGVEEFDATSSMEDLVDAINNDSENSSLVVASIIEDERSSNKYRLELTAVTGGETNLISVTNNPTNLNFNANNISNTVENTWTGATVTASGTSTVLSDKTYTFTAQATGTVGQTASLEIGWDDGAGNTGTIETGQGYTANTALTVADGITLSFDDAAGITSGQTFKVNVFNSIGDVETKDWTNSTAVPVKTGYYTGSTNKTFEFTVKNTGNLGQDEIQISWKDTRGNFGDITFPDTYEINDEIEVYQGVKIKFDTSVTTGLVEDETFSVTAFHTTVQEGQESGMAQVETESHVGFIDKDASYITTVEASFTYTYSGSATSITVPAQSTLSDLAGLINNDSDNPGVSAVIINDGTGLSTAFHLQLIGNQTGSEYKIENISHTLDNFDTGGTSGYGFSKTQTAQNAMLKVDGYPADSRKYIQRDSNTINDIITGVTLSLIGTGESTVSIATDIEKIKDNIKEFVDSLNFVVDYLKAMSAHIESGESEYNGPMIGNYAFQIVQRNISKILTDTISGLTQKTDTYTHIAQIGITTEAGEIPIEISEDETLSLEARRWVIDFNVLHEALANDYEGVQKLFIKDENSDIEGVVEQIKNEADAITAAYTDSDPGILAVLKNNYETVIENIDDKVALEERRIALVENRLNVKFSGLEVLLGKLKVQQNALSAVVDNLNS